MNTATRLRLKQPSGWFAAGREVRASRHVRERELEMQAAEARLAIEQLSAVITESAQTAVQVVAGGRQQAAGVEQIAMAMQNINQATVQSLTSTRQTERAAQNLNQLAGGLTTTVGQYHS